MIYEFVTPSDPITFIAPDDNIAFVCALLLGGGKAFCEREDHQSVPTCLIFASDDDVEAAILKQLGMPMEDFIEAHTEEIATAFDSFAYGSMESRRQYDDALAAITDPQKLAEFKTKHENRNRTSMSQWVKGAWNYAKGIRAKAAERVTMADSAGK